MALTASKLREDIYRILDHVLETGTPVEIERNGQLSHIVAAEPVSKLRALVPHPSFLNTDPVEVVHLDWTDSWNG